MKSLLLLSLIPHFALAIWPAPSNTSLGNSTLWIDDDVPITYNGPNQVGYMHIQTSPNQYAPLHKALTLLLLRCQAIHTEIQQTRNRTLQPLSRPPSLAPLELCFNKTSSHGSSTRETQTSNPPPAPRPLFSPLRFNNSPLTVPIFRGQSPARLTNHIQSRSRHLGKSLSRQIHHTASRMDLPHSRNSFTSTRLEVCTHRMRLFPFRMHQLFRIAA